MDRAKLAEAFKLFDRDGDGQISWPELNAALKSLGVGETNEAEV